MRANFLNSQKFLSKAVIVTMVLIMSAMLAWVSSDMKHPIYLFFGSWIILIAVIGIAHGSVGYGLLTVFITALFIRVTLPTGTASRIPISLILTVGVALWWGMHIMLSKGEISWVKSSINIPLFGFITVCLISLPWSILFRDSSLHVWQSWPFVQLGALSILVLLPVLLFIASKSYVDDRWIKGLTILVVVAGILAILSFYSETDVLSFLQVRPLFPTWFMCISLSYALFDRKLRNSLRVILILAVIAWFYSVFVIRFRWISSWLPALVGMLVILFIRSKKIFIIVLILLISYVLINSPSLQVDLNREWQNSTLTRVDAWSHNWRVTKEHLLFGVGPAGYAVYYMTYFPLEATATHNNYFDVLSQTGLTGLFFFLWMFVAIGIELIRLRKLVVERGDFYEAFSMAALGGFLGTLFALFLGDWILPFVYTQTMVGFDYASYTWLILGAALALKNHIQLGFAAV